MTEIKFEKMEIPGADIGELNCLPDIGNNEYIRTPIRVTEKITEEERKLIGKGLISTILPYQVQDGYDRSRKIREFDSVILENEFLKAVFVPSLGGRLWSLYDKSECRELLYCNPVFQPANLALRNAWFSGGVEWNVGIKGHNPLTCSPMFAQKCINQSGEPVLKMYEYERIRGVVYTVCAALKKDILLVNITIENTEDTDKYMYWWSNIAVPETVDTRVIVPTRESFFCTYEEDGYLLDTVEVPYMDGTDVSYPVNFQCSRDLFFKIPEDEKKWIAAVDGDGKGLIQFSDPYLSGRKMFVWGQQQGGKHWNDWLSDKGCPYIEIQAGILKTQLEHFVMEKNSKISWTEGYSAISGAPQILHGEDYEAAAREVEREIGSKLEDLSGETFMLVSEEPVMYFGSGWGALENKIRKKSISRINVFDDKSLGKEQADWVNLLKNGSLLSHAVDEPIVSYVTGNFWIELLEKQKREDWYDYNQLGVMYYAENKIAEAMQCFQKSVFYRENPWALRNLARIEKSEHGNCHAAAEYLLRAVHLKNDYQPLLVECGYALIEERRYQEWINLYAAMESHLKENGRLRFLLAICYIRLNDIDHALEIMNDSLTINDIREGEYSLSALWVELYGSILSGETGIPANEFSKKYILEKYPLPRKLDFRMH